MKDVADALALLRRLGASPWLIRHHELVAEAARDLLRGMPRRTNRLLDEHRVLLGAALHDAGKIAHPEEARGPGQLHESAGERLLLESGVPREIARCGVTHARWDDPRADVEDRVVALADKLWKGKREAGLEERVTRELAARARLDFWDLFPELDAIYERVAGGADARLARSQELP